MSLIEDTGDDRAPVIPPVKRPARPGRSWASVPATAAAALPVLLLSALASCGGNGPTGPAPDATEGSLEVAAATSGVEPDPDGYTVVLDDDGAAGVISVDDTVVFEGLATGEHEARLTNLAPNCGVEGDNPRTVSVAGGDTVPVDFAVACPGRSTLEVTTSSLGGGLDPDGFRVAVDGGERRSIGPWDTETFLGLASGDHAVELSGLAPECRVGGDNPRQVTAAADDTASVTFRPRCGPRDPVFYARVTTGNNDIYVLRAGTRERVTDHPADEGSPAASPDGDRIAFTSDRDGNREIYVANVDGSGSPRRITDDPASDGSPAWSPDGTRLAFVSDRTGSRDIFVVELSGVGIGGSGPTNLTADAVVDDHPTWSPDGARIAFSSARHGDQQDADIYLMPADGSSPPERLTTSDEDETAPAWSPDGDRIAFASANGARRIHVVGVDGSGRVVLAQRPGNNRLPTWSPDGARVAYSGAALDLDTSFDVYVTAADGSGAPIRLTDDEATDFSPSWSPR